MSDSLKTRFSYKLITNFIGLVMSLVVAGIVPRALGPIAFGNFSFLTDFFTRAFNFFDTGTSTAFYTKLSHQPTRFNLIKFFLSYMGIILLVIISLYSILSVTSIHEILWPKQELLFVFMAIIWAFLMWGNNIFVKIADAYALTKKSELFKVIQRIIQVLLILGLVLTGLFTLVNYFYIQYIGFLLLAFALIVLFKQNGIRLFPHKKIELAEKKEYIKEFYSYSSPLIIFSIFALIEGIFDRWILQKFAGSAQQGFYGLSLRIASLCFLFSSAMMPLIMREFAIAFGEKDNKRIKEIYIKFVPIFFFISAFIAIFTSFQSDKISLILGGAQFKNAQASMMIMALYPIHQTFGQFNGSYFLATNNTKLYSTIEIIFLVLGIPLTFFLIAPSNFFGLNLGSIGLASKMVLIQVIGVNVELWFISKILKFPYFLLLKKQMSVIIFLCLYAYCSFLIADYLFSNVLLSFLFSGLLYTIYLIIFIYFVPSIISSSKPELIGYYQSLVNKIRSINDKNGL